MEIREITDKTEFEVLLSGKSLVMADFFAKWCSPCKMQSSILYEFAKTVQDKVFVLKIDVDENPELANSFDVQSIPTVVLIYNGKEVERKVGLTSKSQLSDMLIKYL